MRAVLRAIAARTASAVLDLVAPRFCGGCDAPLGAEQLFCAPCDAALDKGTDSAPLEGAVEVVASGGYAGPLAAAIRKLKYDGRPDLAAPLAERLARALAVRRFPARALLVPVPLHARKLSDRGYNQSALIADEVARELGFAVRHRALRRCRATSEQAKLGRDDRLKNLKGAIVPGERLEGRLVILVDDVVTTGGTALACIEALRQSGAAMLAVAAVARASFLGPRPR